MDRKQVLKLCNEVVLSWVSQLFALNRHTLTLVAGYEGCANLVYECEREGHPLILRISFRSDRTAPQIQSELHFVNYLAENGVRVSQPILSQNGNLLETVYCDDVPLHIVCFHKGKGTRVPDNGYRYRDDAPIEEYFQNWGQVLGKMHALAKSYQPVNAQSRRPDWFALHKFRALVETRIPERLSVVRARIFALVEKMQALPRTPDVFGLIHGDFNDGNFTVDYANGNITVFDFDDSCYFWFVYELASAWAGGLGRTMFRGLEDRQAFMQHYMDQVLEGYNRENVLFDECLAHLPLFIDWILVEEFMHYVQYIDDPDEETQSQLKYLIRCLEDEIPYKGFFDRIYMPERPFLLD